MLLAGAAEAAPSTCLATSPACVYGLSTCLLTWIGLQVPDVPVYCHSPNQLHLYVCLTTSLLTWSDLEVWLLGVSSHGVLLDWVEALMSQPKSTTHIVGVGEFVILWFFYLKLLWKIWLIIDNKYETKVLGFYFSINLYTIL